MKIPGLLPPSRNSKTGREFTSKAYLILLTHMAPWRSISPKRPQGFKTSLITKSHILSTY